MVSGLVASFPRAFQKSLTKQEHCSPSSNSFSIVTTSLIPSPPSSGSTFQSTQLLHRPIRTLVLTAKMSQSKVEVEVEHHSSVVEVERITVKNNYGENLVGLLHETGSKALVILCHGFRSSKESTVMIHLADAISKEGISVFRFDFAGNGESEGSFQYGNYQREADDLRSVVQYFSGRKHEILTILGHSKGGDVVLLYGSKYHDVPTIINVAGRYDLKKGIAARLGKDFMEVIKRDGYIDVVSKKGQYRVTEEGLLERLGTDMHAACFSIEKGCRVLTVHGSSDEVISVDDAFAFAKIIPNHKLHIIEGADHKFSKHQAELAEVVLNFIKTFIQEEKSKLN